MKQIPLIAGLTFCTILALGSLATAISMADHDPQPRVAHSEKTAPAVNPFLLDTSGGPDWTPLMLCTFVAGSAAIVLRRVTA